ncbi:hypothetical protein ACWEQL_30400 [Kitasatospora sp. NPDC004240]
MGAVRAELRALAIGDDREGMLEGTAHLHGAAGHDASVTVAAANEWS